MTLNTLVIGSHIWFCRGGTTIDSTAINASTAPPDITPTDNWISLGCVEDVSVERDLQRETLYCPSPGQYKKKKNITIQKDMRFQLTMREHSNVFFEMLYATTGPIANAASGGSFVPNDDEGTIEGWWKMQKYDQDDNLIVAMDVWGEASIEGAIPLGRSLNPWTMTLEVLDSAHNTAGLWTLPFTPPT